VGVPLFKKGVPDLFDLYREGCLLNFPLPTDGRRLIRSLPTYVLKPNDPTSTKHPRFLLSFYKLPNGGELVQALDLLTGEILEDRLDDDQENDHAV
jgi:hypothetical protein